MTIGQIVAIFQWDYLLNQISVWVQFDDNIYNGCAVIQFFEVANLQVPRNLLFEKQAR